MHSYDADSESLKHMKPIPEKLLQSLDGDLDFLGPYPFIYLGFSSEICLLQRLYD